MRTRQSRPSGQGLVDYALIVALVAVVVLISLAAIGTGVRDALRDLFLFAADETAGFLSIKDDILARIQAFYDEHGYWPRSWGSYRFTDIGLDPADWAGAAEGIYWSPHGSDVGLANRSGDNLQIYVKDLNGNTLHLYDSWSIWCPVGDAYCYYHTIAPENRIDISTLVVVEE